jgi:hypothetical protein
MSMKLTHIKKGQSIQLEKDGETITITARSDQLVDLDKVHQDYTSTPLDMYKLFRDEFDIDLRTNSPSVKFLEQLFKSAYSGTDFSRYRQQVHDQQLTGLLAESLINVKSSSPETYKELRKKLLSGSDLYSIWGLIYEIIIADTLLFQKYNPIAITEKGQPDFLVEIEGKSYLIECTTVLPTPENAYTVERINKTIQRRINNKNKKKYASFNTILFVDISKCYKWLDIFSVASAYTIPDFENSKFNSIFYTSMNTNQNKLFLAGKRQNCCYHTPEIHKFASTIFPQRASGYINEQFISY